MTDNKVKYLYVAGLAAMLADIMPTPADALYFIRQRHLKQKLENGEITPKQYWVKEATAYYSLNTLWWGAVLGITFGVKGGFKTKATVMGGLVAAGLVVYVIHKNIRKDEEYYKQHPLRNNG